MIDLHSHTTHSDGALAPSQLVDAAISARLEALAITDHDTFSGFEEAAPYAAGRGLDLVCGIELSTWLPVEGKTRGKSAHLLAYFPEAGPPQEFRAWLTELQRTRRERNACIASRLRECGMDVRLEEAEALGRSVTGRPHFARLLVDKGYVKTYADAFAKYLDESAKCYVQRDEPSTAEAVRRVREAGGVPSLAHPVRLNLHGSREDDAIAKLAEAGLPAIEVYHTDHSPGHTARYEEIARRYGLIPTGGSDYHGDHKPAVRLGSGLRGNLAIPKELLERLRQSMRESLPR